MIICDKLQQVFVEYVEVPQLQFIDSMVVFQLLHRDRYAQCKTVQMVSDSTGAVLGGCRHARCCPGKCMIQTVQKTAEFAVCGGCRARRCATTVPGLVQTVLKLWRFRS